MPARPSAPPDSPIRGPEGMSSPNLRPAKRMRNNRASDQAGDETMDGRRHSSSHSQGAGPVIRPRGPSACERCRDRKTKCDFRRPVCGYCTKRQVPCVYPDETSDWSVSGADILAAIGNLSKLVESQAGRSSNSTAAPCCSHHDVSSPASHTLGQTPTSQPAWPGAPSSVGGLPEETMRTQGLDAVLQWDVFEPLRPTGCLFAEVSQRPIEVVSPPTLRYNNLLRLETKYIQAIHNKNPFLDLAELHQMVLNVAENGPDWSTQTCLVALVCAVGAINQSYPTRLEALDPSLATSPRYAEEAGDQLLSLQFWHMAAKRLGLAIGQNDIQSVQCLCLAGIWYMNNLQPLEAWKHFNLAGAAWHCLRLTNRTPGDVFDTASNGFKSMTITQALYFTIWKSECELMIELPLPRPDLDLIRFPHAFPTPPTPGSEPMNTEAGEDERCWYYYLAEIAARHLLNRLVHANYDAPPVLTARHVQRMIREAELMETQIHNWYSSLPPFFHFDIPAGFSIEAHPDDMTQILRHRYLNLREVVGRQFVKLCVENPLDGLDASLRARAVSLAHQSLQYCMLKLSQVRAHRHQGTWFMLRNATASSLVLCAVHLAHQKPWPVGAHALLLPDGWRERIGEARERVGPFWLEPNGGAVAMQEVLDVAVRACSSASEH